MPDNKISNIDSLGMQPAVSEALDKARVERVAKNTFTLDPVSGVQEETKSAQQNVSESADPSADNPEAERKAAEDEKYNQDIANKKAMEDRDIDNLENLEQDLEDAIEAELEEGVELEQREDAILEAIENEDLALQQETPELQEPVPEVKPDETEESDFLGLKALFKEDPKQEDEEKKEKEVDSTPDHAAPTADKEDKPEQKQPFDISGPKPPGFK